MPSDKHRRLDRRIRPRKGAVEVEGSTLTVTFHNEWGEHESSYDLGTLNGLAPDLAHIMADAFRHCQVGSVQDTRRGFWRGIRTFARFAKEEYGIIAARDLTTATAKRYLAWLDRQRTRAGAPWTAVSRRNEYGKLRVLVQWTKQQNPDRLPARIDLPHNPYPLADAAQKPRLRLPDDQLKAILRACYEEIDAAWACFEKGRRLLDAATNLPGRAAEDAELATLLRHIRQIGDGLVPSQHALLAAGIAQVTLTRLGGIRTLAGYLQILSDVLAPYYVAIAIQTAANPEPLRMMRRDCLVAHPLDEHRKIVDWIKPKTGRHRKRAQRRSFDCRLIYAAPNLIEQVLAMTEPLVVHAPARERDRLFLLQSEKNKGVSVIKVPTLDSALKRFIKRSNDRIAIWNRAAPPDRRRESLSNFATAFLRGSVATSHYRATSGDLLAVQRLLNHADPATTEIYVAGPEAERIRHKTIAQLQGLMLAWIRNDSEPPSPTVALVPDPASTFSHTCLNPLNGGGPGATSGRVCPMFGGCLVCPGLVIPITAETLARLLAAKARLEEARDRLEPARWALLYAPTYRALVNDVLPDFPTELVPTAEMLRRQIATIPDLE